MVSERRPALRAVIVPSEHGGWGFTLEPAVLGLLVAPSAAGAALGLAAVLAFLVRQPLRLWMTDRRRGTRHPRTALAARAGMALGGLAILALTLALRSGRGPFLWWLAAAVPLAALQWVFEVSGRGRRFLPEFAGAAAMGTVGPAIVAAGGVGTPVPAGVWLVLVARSLAALAFARAQVLRARGVAVAPGPVYALEALAAGGLAAAAGAGVVPWLAVVAVAALVPFTIWSFARAPVPARVVGWTQIGFGALTVALTALGLRFPCS